MVGFDLLASRCAELYSFGNGYSQSLDHSRTKSTDTGLVAICMGLQSPAGVHSTSSDVLKLVLFFTEAAESISIAISSMLLCNVFKPPLVFKMTAMGNLQQAFGSNVCHTKTMLEQIKIYCCIEWWNA